MKKSSTESTFAVGQVWRVLNAKGSIPLGSHLQVRDGDSLTIVRLRENDIATAVVVQTGATTVVCLADVESKNIVLSANISSIAPPSPQMVLEPAAGQNTYQEARSKAYVLRKQAAAIVIAANANRLSGKTDEGDFVLYSDLIRIAEELVMQAQKELTICAEEDQSK